MNAVRSFELIHFLFHPKLVGSDYVRKPSIAGRSLVVAGVSYRKTNFAKSKNLDINPIDPWHIYSLIPASHSLKGIEQGSESLLLKSPTLWRPIFRKGQFFNDFFSTQDILPLPIFISIFSPIYID